MQCIILSPASLCSPLSLCLLVPFSLLFLSLPPPHSPPLFSAMNPFLSLVPLLPSLFFCFLVPFSLLFLSPPPRHSHTLFCEMNPFVLLVALLHSVLLPPAPPPPISPSLTCSFCDEYICITCCSVTFSSSLSLPR